MRNLLIGFVIGLFFFFAADVKSEPVIKIEAKLSDNSYLLNINGRTFRAFDENGMRYITQISAEKEYFRRQLGFCKDELTRKNEAE
jgi:hypothetical protein